jgi:hypothetical protein
MLKHSINGKVGVGVTGRDATLDGQDNLVSKHQQTQKPFLLGLGLISKFPAPR